MDDKNNIVANTLAEIRDGLEGKTFEVSGKIEGSVSMINEKFALLKENVALREIPSPFKAPDVKARPLFKTGSPPAREF